MEQKHKEKHQKVKKNFSNNGLLNILIRLTILDLTFQDTF